jgi:hypothetical protein
MTWYNDTSAAAPSAAPATEATLAAIKPAVDLVKTAVDATTAAATGTTAAVNAQKAALLAALAPLATESTLALIKPAIDGLKGVGGKTITDIVTALSPLASGATEATLSAVNTKIGTVLTSLSTNNTDNTAIRAALAALQADSATLVGRVYNNHATQLIPINTTVSIPAGAWKSLSVLFLPAVLGAGISGASFDGMSLTNPNLASYTGEYNATTSATTLVTIVTGNCEARVLRIF